MGAGRGGAGPATHHAAPQLHGLDTHRGLPAGGLELAPLILEELQLEHLEEDILEWIIGTQWHTLAHIGTQRRQRLELS